MPGAPRVRVPGRPGRCADLHQLTVAEEVDEDRALAPAFAIGLTTAWPPSSRMPSPAPQPADHQGSPAGAAVAVSCDLQRGLHRRRPHRHGVGRPQLATAPCSSRRSSVPPMMRACPRQIASPSPVPPPRSVARARTARRRAAGTARRPSPWSRTSTSASSPLAADAHAHRRPAVPAGVVQQVGDDALDARRIAQHVQLGRRIDLGARQPQVHDVAHQLAPGRTGRAAAARPTRGASPRAGPRPALPAPRRALTMPAARSRPAAPRRRRVRLPACAARARRRSRTASRARPTRPSSPSLRDRAPAISSSARPSWAISSRPAGLRRASRSPAASRAGRDTWPRSRLPSNSETANPASPPAARRRCRPGRGRRADRRGRWRRRGTSCSRRRAARRAAGAGDDDRDARDGRDQRVDPVVGQLRAQRGRDLRVVGPLAASMIAPLRRAREVGIAEDLRVDAHGLRHAVTRPVVTIGLLAIVDHDARQPRDETRNGCDGKRQLEPQAHGR